uniref:Uncharacterized protein n=1 Tax=Arundo donax TaxID=35708 RepID=A0A0A9E4W2_ARUDO
MTRCAHWRQTLEDAFMSFFSIFEKLQGITCIISSSKFCQNFYTLISCLGFLNLSSRDITCFWACNFRPISILNISLP